VSILITAASSAKAYQLKAKLNAGELVLGDYLDLPGFMLKSAGLIKLPDPASISYSHEMLTLCLDKQIDTIYLLRDDEKQIIKEAEQLFNEFGIIIIHA
jgi:hypothetical protein